jgi:hypothetical protein
MASIVASASKGVMDAVLEKHNGLIADRFFNLIGVPDDIAFLKDELSIIRALINNLEDTDGELNPLVKNWRDQAREMAYDIEDLIDDFMNKQESADANAGFLNKLSHYLKNCRAQHETASQINELKNRLQDIHERRKRIRAEPNFSPSTTIDPRVSALFNEAARLVGIDGPKEELLSQVVHDPSQQLKILSIVGFGGLGKTTLANAVYCEIGGEFNCTAFVSVSQKPTMRTVLYGLLSKLTGNTSPLDTGSVEELISKLARWGPIPLLSFPVLLHLDYAIDYRPPSRAAPLPMGHGEWPPAYKLHWRPGVCDGDDGPIPFGMLPRDRLILRRDRSPPPGDDSSSMQDTASSAFRPATHGAP